MLRGLRSKAAILARSGPIARIERPIWQRRILTEEELRQRLGDDSREPRWLETVRGVGYRMTP